MTVEHQKFQISKIQYGKQICTKTLWTHEAGAYHRDSLRRYIFVL